MVLRTGQEQWRKGRIKYIRCLAPFLLNGQRMQPRRRNFVNHKMKKIRLSILDQSPVRKGSTAEEAIKETVQLAILAEQLGYTRFWVSEHHNTTSLAGSTPEVLIAHLAGQTSRIRLGSGGIMMPNHSALKVAENFRMLETIFPGRIDLGMGRAPGTDRLTAAVLNPSNQVQVDMKSLPQGNYTIQTNWGGQTRVTKLNKKLRLMDWKDLYVFKNVTPI